MPGRGSTTVGRVVVLKEVMLEEVVPGGGPEQGAKSCLLRLQVLHVLWYNTKYYTTELSRRPKKAWRLRPPS